MTDNGVKLREVYGEIDESRCNLVDKPIHVRVLRAAIPPTLGIGHE